jgi:hypothetical protein
VNSLLFIGPITIILVLICRILSLSKWNQSVAVPPRSAHCLLFCAPTEESGGRRSHMGMNSSVQANKKISRCLKTSQLSITGHKWQQVPQYVFLTEVNIQKERALKHEMNQFVYSLLIQQRKMSHMEDEHRRPGACHSCFRTAQRWCSPWWSTTARVAGVHDFFGNDSNSKWDSIQVLT